MMGHPRTNILKVVKDLLLNGNTLAGQNVFVNRMTHPDEECSPYILIYSRGESITEKDVAPQRLLRELDLSVECLAAESEEDDASDTLDQLTWQVELLLSEHDTWNIDYLEDQTLATVRLEYREDGARALAAAVMGYNVEYNTCLPEDLDSQPSANAVDFDRIQGLQGVGFNEFGWDIIGDSGSQEGIIDAELIIEAIP